MSCSERLRSEMRRRGLRLTPQRSVILETLAHLEGHPTALEVYQGAAPRLPGLNLATVYRNLEALQQAGLIDSMEAGGANVRFALRDREHLHHHLVCSECGGEWEVDAEAVRGLAASLQRKHGFHLRTDHLTLVGRCRSCAERSTR
ncbi:MAG TPA: Fur family transcriptional regulator [Anaerolineales bacterium]|nr:Fur family transcriptional regulator [Anaerolineales bacterium]